MPNHQIRSAAARLDFSHLGTLLKLQNLRKCIIGKFRKVPCVNPHCLLPDRDTIFTFPENKLFQQISQRSSSHGTFAFGSTAEAVKPPEMHHKKVPCFNPPCHFGVGGNAARPDYEKVASLVRDTQLRLQRQRSNTWIVHLEGLGNDEEQFYRNSHISLKKLHRTVMDGGAPELLKKLYGLLQVKDVTPLRLSQQYAAQEHLPDKVFYVLGGWRCRFFFRVEKYSWLDLVKGGRNTILIPYFF